MPKLKKKNIRLLVSLLVIILSATGVLATPAKEQVAQFANQENPGLVEVKNASDGDTITVNINGKTERVRLIGVDTPEKNDPRKPVQCFADAASQFMKQKVNNNKVRLEADPQSDNRDRYDRLLRYIYLPDGTLLNKQIIAEGYGFAMTGFLHSKMDEFVKAGRTARDNNLGLWSACEVDESAKYPQTNAIE